MQIIAAGILTLKQSLAQLENLPVCDDRCSCGRTNAFHRHGYYYRKPDRHAEPGQSLNPVKILRFICKFCRRTCYVLPECIPPRRWYLWAVQQAVIQEHLLGRSWNSISRKLKVARSTCRRWVQHLQDKFTLHADVLRNAPGKLCERLVHCFEAKSFWQNCLAQVDLSRAMLLCHNAGIDVP